MPTKSMTRECKYSQNRRISLQSESSVGRNNIGALGTVQMPLVKMSWLNTLRLFGNKIGSVGAKMLTKADLPILQTLQLVGCQLGEQGSKQLMKGQWSSLNQLDIGYNGIKFVGWTAVAVSNWKQLRKITVCWPQDGTASVAALSLVAANWSSKSKVNCYFVLPEVANHILQCRFNQKEG